MLAGAVGTASVADCAQQLQEERPVAFFANPAISCLLGKVAASGPTRVRLMVGETSPLRSLTGFE
jgi:hypothetical protein